MRLLHLTLAVIAAGSFVLIPQTGRAQGNPGVSIIQDQFFNKPTVSPYLNLLRNQGLGLPNYQSFVRPQFEERRAAQQQQVAINQLRQQQAQQASQLRSGSPVLQPTGHVSVFMQYSHFYPRLGSAGGASPAVGFGQ